MADHTTLPWSVDHHNHLRAEDGSCVANVWTVAKRAGHQRANAAFIISAVNSHDALVNALQEINALATCTGVVDPQQHENMLSNIYRIARAALASIKETV